MTGAARCMRKERDMATVKRGDTVRINYTGRLEDGTVFDSSGEGAPLEFVVGAGEFLRGLENGVVDMQVGETKRILIPAAEGYGPHVKERVFEWEKRRIPEEMKPEIGQQLQMFRADGEPVLVTVVGISDSSYTLDCNHPLAGKDLVFDITVEEIA
jgi:peptidylprolyl isomerase